jgi:hypothetical protein
MRNSLFEIAAARSRPDHAIAEESNFSSPTPFRKGTAEMANREVPIKRRIWLPPESALQFLCDRESWKIAGKFNGIAALHLVSY